MATRKLFSAGAVSIRDDEIAYSSVDVNERTSLTAEITTTDLCGWETKTSIGRHAYATSCANSVFPSWNVPRVPYFLGLNYWKKIHQIIIFLIGVFHDWGSPIFLIFTIANGGVLCSYSPMQVDSIVRLVAVSLLWLLSCAFVASVWRFQRYVNVKEIPFIEVSYLPNHINEFLKLTLTSTINLDRFNIRGSKSMTIQAIRERARLTNGETEVKIMLYEAKWVTRHPSMANLSLGLTFHLDKQVCSAPHWHSVGMKDSKEREPREADDHVIAPILRSATLGLICLIAFAIRLFAVVRWESVIHEFDPYFNYRTTKYLSSEGFMEFLNWFDDRSWYPLGRIIGGTIYPGLMATAAAIHYVLNALNVTINVRNMCVFLAPLFAAITAFSTYLLTTEVTKRTSTGLISAALVAIVPSYISRSVAGSYDNEGVAIFALIFTFYLWVKSVNTGSLFWAACAALAYFYMVAAWGGFVFIINIIPIYVVILIVGGRYSARLYTAYSTFYVLGSLLAMQVPFVGFNVVQQAECAASHGVFALLQVYAFAMFVRSKISGELFNRLIIFVAAGIVVAVAVILLGLQLSGKTQWTGRSLSLLDPTYAKKYIPIIASVSEHQPTSWTSFFMDLHICVPFAPVGLYFLFKRVTDAKIFLILYGTIAWYFAGVMVRLMLTLAPAACMLAAVGISGLLNTFMGQLKAVPVSDPQPVSGKPEKSKAKSRSTAAKRAFVPFPAPLSIGIVLGTMAMLVFYSFHATYVSSEAYSSPSIVLASRGADGSRVIFDDFREAYYWLRQNTHPNAKVMSWWDYGYQTTAMANRTVLVDNNTWNNTHIATVGRAMSSTEEDAYPIMQSLDVDYVLAIFGGLTGYQSDDINKFLWMVRIGGGVFPDIIQEPNYYSDGQFRVDAQGSDTLLNCMMYKMCYYRFDEVTSDYRMPSGFDRARNVEIGHKGFELDHLEEAFTSEHWIVRIYKVKKPLNRPVLPSVMHKYRSRKRSSSPSLQETSKTRAREVGCYVSERSFSADRQYSGSSAGANFKVAKHVAESTGKRYFAIARTHTDGHMFAFDHLLERPNTRGDGCARPCMDVSDKACGCADDACGEPIPAGEEHNRRWMVYEIGNSNRRG